MGLDSVELVMEVEDRFGITIKDEEAEQIRTVGQLAALIESLIITTSSQICPSLHGFLQTRRFIREFLGEPQLRLRPSKRIASIVPTYRRQELWSELRRIYGASPPELQRPGFLQFLLSVATVLIFAFGLSTGFFDPRYLLIGIPLAIAAVIALYQLTDSFRTEPPARLTNFGQLSRYVTGFTMITNPVESSSVVMKNLREIIVDVLGVDPKEVVPEARFVEDLGMN